MQRVIARLSIIASDAARTYFAMELDVAVLEEFFAGLLGPPREMWQARLRGLVTKDELVGFLGAHLHSFLLARVQRRSVPDLLMQDLAALSEKIEEALTTSES